MRDPVDILHSELGLPESEIDKALVYQQKYGGQLEQILVHLGSLSADNLPDFYANLLNLQVLQEDDVADWTLPEMGDLPWQRLAETGWFPVSLQGEQWTFASSNPLNANAYELLVQYGIDFKLVVASASTIHFLKTKAEQEQRADTSSGLSELEESRLRELASEAPTVNLLNNLISRALKQRSSDMHLEPVQGRGKVRFRIDGVLQDADFIPSGLLLPVITRLKILAGMDIAEKRRPQDGKIEMRINGMDIDIRVSALPLNDGTSVVLRFLRKDSIRYDMAALGIAPDIEEKINQDLQKTAGVILLTGPTGSGKTTSLYTFLHKLNQPSVKIITLEDPVEYQLDGINQVQVQADIGFNFAAGLRSIVRQDPDIIMLGEIRDSETANIAMQSALTGHLVFSTVHTNDAPSAYTRLLDLGVEEFLLDAALVSIVAQRLVRQLCTHCSQPLDEQQVAHLSEHYRLIELSKRFGCDLNLKQPVGCAHCHYQGYLGRVAVIEYLRCDDGIRALPKGADFLAKARIYNAQQGGRTLFEDGLYKVIQGITTLDEVIRVAG